MARIFEAFSDKARFRCEECGVTLVGSEYELKCKHGRYVANYDDDVWCIEKVLSLRYRRYEALDQTEPIDHTLQSGNYLTRLETED